MNKELKDYSYTELVTYLSGMSIMYLGEGKSIRDIVGLTTDLALRWKAEKDKETKKIHG